MHVMILKTQTMCVINLLYFLLVVRSAIAKKNRANAAPHTSGNKSHARVANEMVKTITPIINDMPL